LKETFNPFNFGRTPESCRNCTTEILAIIISICYCYTYNKTFKIQLSGPAIQNCRKLV